MPIRCACAGLKRPERGAPIALGTINDAEDDRGNERVARTELVGREGRSEGLVEAADEITLEWNALTSDAEPDQQLVVYTAQPGSRSERALRELATWATENIGASGSGARPARWNLPGVVG